MKNTKKTANKLSVPGKVKKGFRFYCAAVLSVALVLGCSVTAFAANDPIAVVNNLSDFIFGLIHSLKQGETHVLGEATILKRIGDNDYLAEYNGVKCHAIFNPFAGRYFVDDVYGVIRSSPDRDSR